MKQLPSSRRHCGRNRIMPRQKRIWTLCSRRRRPGVEPLLPDWRRASTFEGMRNKTLIAVWLGAVLGVTASSRGAGYLVVVSEEKACALALINPTDSNVITSFP